MDISLETLRKSIGALPDDDLVKRWHTRMFTDEALPIAEAEIRKRQLDTSTTHLDQIRAEELAGRAAFRSRNWRKARHMLIVTALLVVGMIGAAIAALMFK